MSWSIDTAARTLFQEARGEPLDGQQAVAWVLRNRLASGRWGRSLASVCLWHAQFSGWWCPRGTPPYYDPNFAAACGLADNDPVLQRLAKVLSDVLGAEPVSDPTGGALFYHASSMLAAPAWARTMRLLGQHGHQSFYTDQSTPPTGQIA